MPYCRNIRYREASLNRDALISATLARKPFQDLVKVYSIYSRDAGRWPLPFFSPVRVPLRLLFVYMTGHMHRRALMAKKTSIGLILIIG
jgi:hypothetical protein